MGSSSLQILAHMDLLKFYMHLLPWEIIMAVHLLDLNANTPFYNILGGIAMLIGRYWIAIPALQLQVHLRRKKIIPVVLGTLTTHTPLFIILLISVTIIIGALSFFPALALGPIVEQLMLWGQYGH